MPILKFAAKHQCYGSAAKNRWEHFALPDNSKAEGALAKISPSDAWRRVTLKEGVAVVDLPAGEVMQLSATWVKDTGHSCCLGGWDVYHIWYNYNWITDWSCKLQIVILHFCIGTSQTPPLRPSSLRLLFAFVFLFFACFVDFFLFDAVG